MSNLGSNAGVEPVAQDSESSQEGVQNTQLLHSSEDESNEIQLDAAPAAEDLEAQRAARESANQADGDVADAAAVES